MGIEQPKPEEVVTKLRYVDLLCGQGMARVDAIREGRINEHTFCHCERLIWMPPGSKVELTRFRGYLPLLEGGFHDA